MHYGDHGKLNMDSLKKSHNMNINVHHSAYVWTVFKC